MERKEHIEKMQLLGRMLGPTANGIPATAVTAGLEYAQHLTRDAALQADVKKTFNASLAARDIKRAAEVLEKYRKPITPKPVASTPGFTDYKPPELATVGIVEKNWNGNALVYRWTVKGEAWKQAGRPNPHTWEYIRETKAATPPQPTAPTPPDLTEFKAYFPEALKFGVMTFERVPQGKLKVNGKNIREIMIAEGFIDTRLFLTDKGKAWLTEDEII